MVKSAPVFEDSQDAQQQPKPAPGSRWESLVWPQWLPVRSRLPLIAQLTAGIALLAAIMMPRAPEVVPVAVSMSTSAAVLAPFSMAPAPAPTSAPPPSRPAYLNLDLRHSLRMADVSVTVDGESVLQTAVPGSGRRFGVVGKRGERGFTRTLDLDPGVRVVRIRVRSADDKFDQTRVERFDLDPAAVATLRVAADKSGLSVLADRPPVTRTEPAPPVAAAPVAAVETVVPTRAEMAARAARAAGAANDAQAAQEVSAFVELYQTLRSTLIAMAGFIASAATGFLVESYLRTRRAFAFAQTNAGPATSPVVERRRRRRAERAAQAPDIPAGSAG